ncbi:UNKNOWN [Stylonychia lemnae]|uniref:Regulator of chromosome condensation n=1 Tax=Stylonychia lemnae TaxID=5949 RepID=A0A078AT25_STYLE|nr:UNKNOWN [Stylonychia lemnae]|eukprot:CDW85161.1 UNKNOWN [Stylonychia lemnae]
MFDNDQHQANNFSANSSINHQQFNQTMQTHSFGQYNMQNQSMNYQNNSGNFNYTLKQSSNRNSNDSSTIQDPELMSPMVLHNQPQQEQLGNIYLTNHKINKNSGNYQSTKRPSTVKRNHINLLSDDEFDEDLEIENQRKLQVQAHQPPDSLLPIVDAFNDNRPLQMNQSSHKSSHIQQQQQYQLQQNQQMMLQSSYVEESSMVSSKSNNTNSNGNSIMPIQLKNNTRGSSELYVWGRNQNGQLGIEPSMKSVIKIPHLLKLNILVTQISCGKSHTALVTNEGELYTMGSNQKGQLGLGATSSKYLSSPELVEALSMYHVKMICCSRNATFALMSAQEFDANSSDIIFSWGSEKDGVLGIGSVEGPQHFPIKVMIEEENEEQLEILDMSTGKAHVAIIVRRKNEVDQSNGDVQMNSLYMWGSNKYGQLGLWDFDNRNAPTFLDVEFSPLSVCCGDSFSIVQTQQGTIYSSGSNLQGQLGQSQTVNKVSVFSQITNITLKPEVTITKICASDFSSCLLSNGEMYIWGPTPIGQFNSPQMLQDLIQNNIGIKDMSLGTSFGLIQDQNNLTYQIGSLFQESKNTTSNFQYLDNMNFEAFTCGHDFVVASSANQQYHSAQPKSRQSMKLTRSNTQSLLQYQKNIVKKRQPSDHHIYNKVHLQQQNNNMTQSSINNPMNLSIQQFNINNLNANHHQQQQQQYQQPILHQQQSMNGYSQQQQQMSQQKSQHNHYHQNNNSQSPLRISNINGLNMTTTTNNINFDNGNNLNNSTLNNFGLSSTASGQNFYNRHSNIHQSVNHANGYANILSSQQNTQQQQRRESKRQHLDSCTPVRRDLTPSQLEHRLQQTPSNSNTPSNMQLRIQNQNHLQLNHMQSYAASNTDDLLSQTLINTPQQLRRTFAGQPQHSLMSHHCMTNQATPPPYGSSCPCNNPMCMNSSYAAGFPPQSNPMMYQSIDHQSSHQQHNYHQHQVDFLIKEKQEMHHQLNVEIQRRLLQEKELNEAFKQLDGINSQHQQNIHELTQMLDLHKRDNDSLMNQVTELEHDTQALKEANETLQEELTNYKQLYEDLQSKQQTMVRENEYLKTRVELSQQIQITQSNTGVSNEKIKEIEDTLQKKNKEIYDLTVQLGCLKEENNQLKKDNEEMSLDFSERLQHQQIRAEADYMVVQDENEQLRSTIEQLKVIREEVQQLKVLQEEKNAKMEDMQNLIDKLQDEIELKDDNEKIQQREISILHQEQDKLLKELKKLQSQQKFNPKQTKQNQKNLHLSTTMPDDNDGFDIEDLRRAADDILREQSLVNSMVFKSNITPINRSNMASIVVNLDHSHNSQPPSDNLDCINQKTQIINLIETPIESHRNSSFYQPVISAHTNGQSYMQSHFRMNDRNHQTNLQNSQSMHQNHLQNTLTPKELMYQKLKQSMISGKDSRSTTNREQGCLQVPPQQRRKSTQAQYSQNVKNLRSSKSGGNMKFKATTSRINNMSNVARSTDQNINPDSHLQNAITNAHSNTKSIYHQQQQKRESIQNMPAQQKSPIAFTKKKSVNNLMPNQRSIECFDHPLDALNHTVFIDQTNKSPLKQMTKGIQQSQTTTNSQLASKNFNQLNQALGQNKYDKNHYSNNTAMGNNENINAGESITAQITGKVISGGGKISQAHTPKQKLVKDSSKGSLFDMKHKLQDIQHNKQYLEKKIYEYEKKLNELKGTSTQNVGGDLNNRLGQTFNNTSQNTKLNTLSGSLLEKVFK